MKRHDWADASNCPHPICANEPVKFGAVLRGIDQCRVCLHWMSLGQLRMSTPFRDAGYECARGRGHNAPSVRLEVR